MVLNDFLDESSLQNIISLVDKNQIEKCYGFCPTNWGDLQDFQGNYINFGYWKGISLSNILTIEDRIQSSENLYLHIIDHLNLNNHDSVLEIGCGRGNGIASILHKYTVNHIIGIDILDAQIERTKKNLEKHFSKNTNINLLATSADSTTLKDHSVDKIFSVEVIQHFKTCRPFAKEIKRILKPNGKFVFAAHLSTSKENFIRAKNENLIISGDELLPLQQVIDDFKAFGFNIQYYSIGEYVFEGYEKWITQIKGSSSSHYLYKAYIKNLIDYYVIIVDFPPS